MNCPYNEKRASSHFCVCSKRNGFAISLFANPDCRAARVAGGTAIWVGGQIKLREEML